MQINEGENIQKIQYGGKNTIKHKFHRTTYPFRKHYPKFEIMHA